MYVVSKIGTGNQSRSMLCNETMSEHCLSILSKLHWSSKVIIGMDLQALLELKKPESMGTRITVLKNLATACMHVTSFQILCYQRR